VVGVEGEAKCKGKMVRCRVCGGSLIRIDGRWVHPGWTDHGGTPEGDSKWYAGFGSKIGEKGGR